MLSTTILPSTRWARAGGFQNKNFFPKFFNSLLNSVKCTDNFLWLVLRLETWAEGKKCCTKSERVSIPRGGAVSWCQMQCAVLASSHLAVAWAQWECAAETPQRGFPAKSYLSRTANWILPLLEGFNAAWLSLQKFSRILTMAGFIPIWFVVSGLNTTSSQGPNSDGMKRYRKWHVSEVAVKSPQNCLVTNHQHTISASFQFCDHCI